MRAFGSNRDGGARAHGGCDLYAPLKTPIYAVADGVVISDAYPFYCQTYALEVNHGAFVVRYGEIHSALVKKGDKVKVGQKIALVGHLVGIKVPSDMCHFEMFAGTATGPLSTSKDTARRKDKVPFKRRADLMDPTPFLNEWKKSLPQKG
jgi:murein DD-endopeptidase MepM/ murein hydrolase activator NlpD